MSDFTHEFYEFLKKEGFDPASNTSIVADDKRHRFATTGRRDKSSEYQLAVRGADFAYGWARDYRSGLFAAFSTRTKRRLSADDRERVKAEIELAKAQSRIEKQRAAEEAREKAERLWEKASCKAEPTPYEARKQIKRYGTRVLWGKTLIVPVLNEEDDIISVQMVSDNDKKFLKNSNKNGHWFRLGEMPQRGSDLIICEGYATGCSIHEATGQTVIVAFDAGNLLPVAKKLCKKYNIVIAADNDAGTVIDGKHKNVGLLRAQEVIDAVGGRVCAPPLEDGQHPARSRDFNDLHVQEGLDAVRAALGVSTEIVTKEPEPEDNLLNWRSGLIPNRDGDPVVNSLVNLELFLENHPDLLNLFAYDEFSLRVIVKRCPIWEKQQNFKVHDFSTNDLTRFLIWCESQGLRPSKDSAFDLIVSAAHNNSFHPAREYFNSLTWDGKERLNRVMKEIYNCDDDPQYLATVFRKWLVGAVARIYDPGCKFDTMLILEGPQNIGKSKSLLTLSTFNGASYFADNVKDIHNKDTIMTMQGKLIIEFAELAAWRNAETNDLKAFISRQVDMYRPPYERTVCDIPRQCVFAGTTNPTGGYFRDATGNRRFWPTYCTGIDHAKLDEWKEQLWAEAVTLYHAGEQIWLNHEEHQRATLVQEQRMQADAWLEDIQELIMSKSVNGTGFVTNGEIYHAIGIEKAKKDEYTLKRIQKVMTSIGWFESRKSIGGAKVRGWKQSRLINNVEEKIEW